MVTKKKTGKMERKMKEICKKERTKPQVCWDICAAARGEALKFVDLLLSAFLQLKPNTFGQTGEMQHYSIITASVKPDVVMNL